MAIQLVDASGVNLLKVATDGSLLVNMAAGSVTAENITQIGGAALALGLTTATHSIPVVLASDQAALAVSGAFYQTTQPVSGTVTITPSGTQTITGSVSVSNLPSTQAVSGTVSISNFPSSQTVAGAVTVSGTVTATPAAGSPGTGASTPFYDLLVVGGAAVSSGNPLPVTTSGTTTATQGPAGASAWPMTPYVGGAAASAANPNPVQLSQAGVALSATNPIFTQPSVGGSAVSATNPVPVTTMPGTALTTVGVANTALTVTIPASGVAALSTYITGIQIYRANGATASAVGAAALAITTTNLGTLAFRYTSAVLAAGATDLTTAIIERQYSGPLKSAAANTASTIVLPIPGTTATTVYWVVEVYYFFAP